MDPKRKNETQHSMRKFSIEEADDSHLTTCGIGSWRPKYLQKYFGNPIAFMANLCIVNIFQSMAGSVMLGTLSTLERRYAFNSQLASVIMIADCLFITLLSPLVGHIAVRFNRARMIACSEIILGLACLLTTVPYFIYGPAKHMEAPVESANQTMSNGQNYEMCMSHHYECSQHNSQNTVWLAVVIFFIGNLIRGVGFTTYYIVAMPFIDDSVPKKNSPFYISAMHAINLIGKLVGYFFVAYCLSLPENPWSEYGATIDRKDPNYIGAWWVGFFVAGVCVILSSIPLFCFPSQFKSANLKTKEIQKKLTERGASFTESLLRFIRNPLVLLFFLGNEFRFFGIDGFYMFLVKYLESQYRQSSSSASMLTGSSSFAPISIGLIVGGLYISYGKPRARLLFTLVFLAELVSVFTIGSGIWLGCEQINLQGVSPQDGTFSLASSCTQNCDCTTRMYTPVCDSKTQTTYFSPCHAGCSGFNPLNSTFEKCSCIDSGSATKGYCESDLNCSNLSTYIVLLTIGTLISATAKTGNSLITFRAVEPMDKSFTNGILSSLVALLGFIPCELFYGHLVDTNCLVWESKCGKQGNCWIYDQNKFRKNFLGITVTFLALGSLFDFIIIFYSDRINNLYGDEDEKGEEEK